MTDYQQYDLPVTPNRAFSCVWQLSTLSGVSDDEIAPDGCCELIIHLAQPPMEWRDGTWSRQPTAFIYGPLTKALRLRQTSRMDMIALRFEPYGIGQFHENAFALRNQAIPLDKVFSNTRQLIDLARQDLALNVFAEKALSLIMVQRREPYGYMLVKNACNQFLRTPTLTPDDLSKVARCSQRTLNRHFKRVCGLTVSEFVRINRFQTARQAIKYGDTSLSDVAALAGYVDQAHMTRAFKALAGLTPHQMRSRLTFDDLYQNRPDILLADNSNGTA